MSAMGVIEAPKFNARRCLLIEMKKEGELKSEQILRAELAAIISRESGGSVQAWAKTNKVFDKNVREFLRGIRRMPPDLRKVLGYKIIPAYVKCNE